MFLLGDDANTQTYMRETCNMFIDGRFIEKTCDQPDQLFERSIHIEQITISIHCQCRIYVETKSQKYGLYDDASFVSVCGLVSSR